MTAMAIKRVAIAIAPSGEPIATGEVASIVTNQTAPGFVAVDSTYVYWTTGNANLSKYPLAQVGLGGGTIMTVTSGQSFSFVAIDASNFYWSNSTGIQKLALAGGTATNLYMFTSGTPYGLGMNGNSLYWISGNDGMATLMSLTPN
jgi:hypothetical protein